MQQLLFPNVDDWVHAYTYIYRKTCEVSTHLSLWGCLCLAACEENSEDYHKISVCTETK